MMTDVGLEDFTKTHTTLPLYYYHEDVDRILDRTLDRKQHLSINNRSPKPSSDGNSSWTCDISNDYLQFARAKIAKKKKESARRRCHRYYLPPEASKNASSHANRCT